MAIFKHCKITLPKTRRQQDVPLQEMCKNSNKEPIKVDVTFIKRGEREPVTMRCKYKGCRQPFIIDELFNDNDVIEIVCPMCAKTSKARYFADGNYLWGHLKEEDILESNKDSNTSIKPVDYIDAEPDTDEEGNLTQTGLENLFKSAEGRTQPVMSHDDLQALTRAMDNGTVEEDECTQK